MKKMKLNKSCVVLGCLVSACAMVVMLAGCQRVPLPGETAYKESNAGPIYYFENIEGVNEDGSTWKKERGNACCWLSYWERQKKYDKDGFLLEAKEKSGFFPIWSSEETQSKELKEHKATFLCFPYQSRSTGQVSSDK
jgi:hypothetical protein